MIGKNGKVFYVVADITPHFDADGNFAHTQTFIRDDLDELIHKMTVEEQIRKYAAVTEAKDRFIRIMFNEIRTPLHIMVEDTKLLQELTVTANNINTSSVGGSGVINMLPIKDTASRIKQQVSIVFITVMLVRLVMCFVSLCLCGELL